MSYPIQAEGLVNKINRKYVGLERQYKVCNFRLKAEIRWSLGWAGQFPPTAVCVRRLSHYFTKTVPATEKMIYANTLWLYSYFTQKSPSKNKNINYSFIYLRVFRCLYSGLIHDIYDLGPVPAEFLQWLITNLVTINDSTG